jgi:hypothetical protein
MAIEKALSSRPSVDKTERIEPLSSGNRGWGAGEGGGDE